VDRLDRAARQYRDAADKAAMLTAPSVPRERTFGDSPSQICI
jgi:hypothetical protein